MASATSKTISWKWRAATQRKKTSVPIDGIAAYVENLLKDIQDNLFNRALEYRNSHITRVDNFADFQQVLKEKAALSPLIGTAQPKPS